MLIDKNNNRSCDHITDINSPLSDEQEQNVNQVVPAFMQKFRKAWINSEKFACFESYGKDSYYAWCKICLEKLSVGRGGKSNLSTHLQTKRHIQAAIKVVYPKDQLIDTLMNPSITEQITEAELKICAWAAENNISFAAVEKLSDVIRSIDSKSEICSKLKLDRTKSSAIVKGVLAQEQHERLVTKMRNQNFSLIIDESTDISTNKTLAKVIRLMESKKEKFKAEDVFYKAIELKAGDHRTIYQAIVDEFINDDIDYKNKLKGFSSDGASVMMGSENSVMKLLKKDCPDLIVIKCTCHSLALCASYACAKIPSYVEHLLEDIYNYLAH
ncbi:uncharacterized protein LOC131440055 [Malaya genurostris]|uniref:uncharacterized protein LOC131432488 n=1 Tax=Malaya genurostris TaxID=325434 RepID=UPI0026F3B86A|nr:uncharacterized protein LOC131432488 [Malaya genurostris]XP_058467126.1 uncharacterized protein LOC131440053 [Malaya genurostris]XP_058467129.1 uncharacterized protein LOC131440055 [Malaya genurostris]